ncbi:MAG: hypothetical protein RMJ28_04755 [Nitrososphaerota archaeon]|nr:hypothetical protein [Candidatus Calditenuaceae archaeon]MDW8073529.1 hypothetical protein [Nitrososphaerota archaeon]
MARIIEFVRSMGGRRRKEGLADSYGPRLSSALLVLNTQINRLKNKYAGLEARGKEYFERCIQALQMGDEGYAAIYANEIAELRRIARIVLQSLLVLEQVRVRMESLLELREIIGLAPVLKGLLERVRAEIVKVVPEAAESLDSLSSAIDSLIAGSGISVNLPAQDTGVEELSDEAAKILDEARALIAQKVAESFPEVPTLTPKERQVYNYITSLPEGSVLDVETASYALGIPEREVEEILRRLEEKGLIEVSQAEMA